MKGTSAINLLYTIDDDPPIHISLLLGLQQFLTCMGGTIAMPYIVGEAACVGNDTYGLTLIMGSIMFVNGISTLLQVLFGTRLPIIQGASFAFIAPMLAMRNTEMFKCPEVDVSNGDNGDSEYLFETVITEEHRNVWRSRMATIQGAILISGVFEFILGVSGGLGIILKYIGPLTIAPTTSLIGLSLIEDAVSHYAAKNWPIALLTLALIILFTLYLSQLNVPLPKFSASIVTPRYFRVELCWKPIFGMFPILLAILLSWGFCGLLTVSNVYYDKNQYGYHARTDIRTSQLTTAPWFRVPYPGQHGLPQVFLASVLGMFAAIISSVVESIGDYCAYAKICGVPRPPGHAVNRGIAIEGLGCIIAGAIGSGPGVTSYSENIGAVAITRVASRRIAIVTACLSIICGCITKFAAVLVSIPDPVIGGCFIAMFSMVASVGFSNLQYINLNSTRNLLIFGLSIFLGLATPIWTKRNLSMIQTGSETFDQILIVLLSTGMLIGGVIGFILDNTVPGATRKERGLDIEVHDDNSRKDELRRCYDLPLIGQWIRSKWFFKYVPVCPTFQQRPQKNEQQADEKQQHEQPISHIPLDNMDSSGYYIEYFDL